MITRSKDLFRAGILDIEPLENIEPEELSWIWPGRIARGKITMIVGDPGDGKSYLSIAIAAAISRGWALPEGVTGSPGACLLWNGEDGVADTIRVRAERVGADLSRLHVIHGKKNDLGEAVPFSLAHVDDLREEIERRGDIDLVTIDPIGALLSGVDARQDAEVRSTLQPLADLALRTGVAVLIVAHLNKATAQRALYRVGGSIGFVGLARSVLLVARDRESGRRAVTQVKSNLAESVPPIEFCIDDDGLTWVGIAQDLDTERLLGDPQEMSALDEARRTILEAIEDAGGELSAKALEDAMRQSNLAPRTYQRARADLARERKIERHRAGYQQPVTWRILRLTSPYDALHENMAKNEENGELCSHTSPTESIHRQKHTYYAKVESITRTREDHGRVCSRCHTIGICSEHDGQLICRDCTGSDA